MKKITFLIIICFTFSSCSKFLIDEGECNWYYFDRGENYPDDYNPNQGEHFWLQKCSSRIEFSFTIDASMQYNPSLLEKNGFSKIRGMVCCDKFKIAVKNILEYSARIGWRCPTDSTIDLGYIIHLPSLTAKGEHDQKVLLKNVKPGDRIYCTIEDRDEKGFYISIENLSTGEFAEILADKQGSKNADVHKLLEAPYIGGNYVLEHYVFFQICQEKI